MEEIKVGEYVRTTDGKIGKIVKYENFEYYIKIDKDETLILGDKEKVKQHFENKAKEVE